MRTDSSGPSLAANLGGATPNPYNQVFASMTRSLERALEIVHYPHPTLRYKAQPLKRVNRELLDIVREMFRLMYEANGVGLAANQVDLPIRMFVVNLASNPEEGEELVFINPVLSRPKGTAEMEEGCLSLPGVYGTVKRPKQIHVQAFGVDGSAIDSTIDGMLARVVQHENDHLDGVLFPDRLTESGRASVAELLDEFETDFRSRLETGEQDSDDVIESRRADWLDKFCR